MDPSSLVEAVVQQRAVLFAFSGAVVATALAGSLLASPTYQAVALVHLLPRAGREMHVADVLPDEGAGYLEVRDRARTQMQIIASRSVREEAVRRYNALGYRDILPTAESLDALAQALTVVPREDTQLVEIGVLHHDPERAAILANLIADVYCTDSLGVRTGAAEQARDWLAQQAESARAALDAATAEVLAFKQAHDLVDVDEEVDGVSARMQALQAARGATTTERVLLGGKLEQHKRLLKEGNTQLLVGMFSDAALDTMAREQATTVMQAAEVLSRYGDEHPEHQREVEQGKRVDALVAATVQRNVDAERAQLDMLVRQEADLDAELARVKDELLEKQRLRAQYAELALKEDRAKRLYAALGDRESEVDLQAATRLTDVRLVDRALPPTRPVSPNLLLNLAVGVGVGGAGGLGLALLRHRLDDTLRSPADVEHALDVPLLGAIPSLPADTGVADAALYTINHPRSAPAEALRGIRAILQGGAGPGRSRRLLVTSCLQDEGRTLTTVGLGAAFARLGASVLVIDADLRLPQQHTLFSVPIGPGLSDALADIHGAERFVRPTGLPGLHVLPSGTHAASPTELLASAQLDELLTALGRTWPIILIDTPPAALVSDALALAPKADGVLLVVRSGRVTRSVARATLRQLRRVGAQVAGVVLNDVPPDEHAASAYFDEGPEPGASVAS